MSRSRSTYSHGDAAQADIRTQPFSDPGRAPEHARYADSESVLSSLHIFSDSLLAGNLVCFEGWTIWLGAIEGGEGPSDSPVFVSVHQRREDIVCVGACADEEQDDEQQRLEVEER